MSEMKFGTHEMYQYIKDNIGRFRGNGAAYDIVYKAIDEGVKKYCGYHKNYMTKVGLDPDELISIVQEKLIEDDCRRLRGFIGAFEKDRVAYRSRNKAFEKLLNSVILKEYGEKAPNLKKIRSDGSELVFGMDDIFLFIENNLANIADHAVYGKIDGVIEHDCSVLLSDAGLSYEELKTVTEKTKTAFYKNIVQMICDSKEACTEKAVERNRNNWLFKVTDSTYKDWLKKYANPDVISAVSEADSGWDTLTVGEEEYQSPLEQMIKKNDASEAIKALNMHFQYLITHEKDVAALMAFIIEKIDLMNSKDRVNGSPKKLAGRMNGKSLYYLYGRFISAAEESGLHLYRKTLDMLYSRLKIPDGDQTVGDRVFDKKVKAISDYNSRLTKKLQENKNGVTQNYSKGDNQK